MGKLGTRRLPVPKRDIPAKEAGVSSPSGYCRDRDESKKRAGRRRGEGDGRGVRQEGRGGRVKGNEEEGEEEAEGASPSQGPTSPHP